MCQKAEFLYSEGDGDNISLDGTSKSKKSIHSVSVLIAFGAIAVLLGLYGVVYAVDNILPTPLYLSDEKTFPDAFITERARHDLKLMTDLGPRIAGGYENEVLTVDFLKREINLIIQRAHPSQKIELDVQVVSGSYYLNMTPFGKILAYSNLQNIVVKLHSTNSSNSLLVNAHFDSVPTSPGGSDDGINCAVMLEVLRKISKKPQRPLHNIIFLFNGAEEAGLQAAHGFITKHKWAKESKVVINLEAAGAGGKIVLFQSGPEAPWLMKYYNKVPHPYGQAAGEEIFQSNIVPSDTDFRTFRVYGGLIGLDMAFFKHGYRYHTKYDDFEHIPLGSFQHVGDNTLSLIRDISNAPELSDPKADPGKVIFFDFLGLFMLCYNQTVAHVVNYITVFLSFIIFVLTVHSFKLGYTLQTLKYFAFTFGAIIGSWILAAVFVALAAFLIDKIGYAMSWYANPWLILGLYVTPAIALSSILLPFVKHKNLSLNVNSQIQAHAVRIIWTVILLFGTIFNIRAMYALTIPVLSNSVAFVIIYLFKLQHTSKPSENHLSTNYNQFLPVRKWQIIYVIFLIIPIIFLMYSSLTTLSLFIPITGRNGPDENADLLIGMLSLFFTILITSPVVALVTLVRDLKYLLIFLGAVFIVSFIIIFTPLGFPYSGNTDSPAAERYWILHTSRVFHGENGEAVKRDSGYFILNLDRNSPDAVKNYVQKISEAKSLEEDCKAHLWCGLPLVHSKMIQIITSGTWIPAGQPKIDLPTKLEVISKVYVSPTNLLYNISVTGPDRIGLYFSPKRGVKVRNISLINQVPSADETAIWNDRDLYFVFYIYGKNPAPLQFTFEVETPSNSTDVTTEIGVSGIYVHDKLNKKVPHYVKFLNQFPDWADLTVYVASYKSWWI